MRLPLIREYGPSVRHVPNKRSPLKSTPVVAQGIRSVWLGRKLGLRFRSSSSHVGDIAQVPSLSEIYGRWQVTPMSVKSLLKSQNKSAATSYTANSDSTQILPETAATKRREYTTEQHWVGSYGVDACERASQGTDLQPAVNPTPLVQHLSWQLRPTVSCPKDTRPWFG